MDKAEYIFIKLAQEALNNIQEEVAALPKIKKTPLKAIGNMAAAGLIGMKDGAKSVAKGSGMGLLGALFASYLFSPNNPKPYPKHDFIT